MWKRFLFFNIFVLRVKIRECAQPALWKKIFSFFEDRTMYKFYYNIDIKIFSIFRKRKIWQQHQHLYNLWLEVL